MIIFTIHNSKSGETVPNPVEQLKLAMESKA